jgi:hypothetical protein
MLSVAFFIVMTNVIMLSVVMLSVVGTAFHSQGTLTDGEGSVQLTSS